MSRSGESYVSVVNRIDQGPTADINCFGKDFGACFGLDRRTRQEPSQPFSLRHVIRVGKTREVAGVTVEVVARRDDAFLIRLDGPPFWDVATSIFAEDITWLAEQDITKGCNPPDFDRFCPDRPVTRGQMAAFLKRALRLPQTDRDFFTDDNDSIFEGDINRLAATGITKGCNPPDFDRFCPDRPVTRGEMAAFLHRAEPYIEGARG